MTKTPLRKLAIERDGYKCADCGTSGVLGSQKGSLKVHHVIPQQQGGADTLDNMVTVCIPCHTKRHVELKSYTFWRAKPSPSALLPTDLTSYRERHHLTQMELARALGVHYSTVSLWEAGKRRIPAPIRLALESLERGL